MKRYLIIAIAVLAAVLVMTLIRAWQEHRARKRGVPMLPRSRIGMSHIVGLAAGLAVFFLGAVILESGSSAPWTSYQPAQIRDGKITSGGFAGDDSN